MLRTLQLHLTVVCNFIGISLMYATLLQGYSGKFSKISLHHDSANLEKLVYDFISFQIDYCNSLFIWIPFIPCQTTLALVKFCVQACHQHLEVWKYNTHPEISTLAPSLFRSIIKVLHVLLTFKALSILSPLYVSDLVHYCTFARSRTT